MGKTQFFHKCPWQQVEPQMTDATVRKPVKRYPLNTVFCGPMGIIRSAVSEQKINFDMKKVFKLALRISRDADEKLQAIG
ncbi:hypothetical protein T03_13385 [Trichinella britovi]|uniref:Uncharacterized protein n=1 Tax=Trichinella britovi TaxID=45882 RepID=A0A0V1DH80_TRIBR|nr:hypothetical protein T03_13385 [Trichinella britovi]